MERCNSWVLNLADTPCVYLLVSPCSVLLIILREVSQCQHQLIPLPINYQQGQSDVRRPYLQPWKQLEVNNEAWLLCFMSCCKIATMIKISVRWKTMVQPIPSTPPMKYMLTLFLPASPLISFHLHDLVCRPLPWLTGLLQIPVLLTSGKGQWEFLACDWVCMRVYKMEMLYIPMHDNVDFLFISTLKIADKNVLCWNCELCWLLFVMYYCQILQLKYKMWVLG